MIPQTPCRVLGDVLDRFLLSGERMVLSGSGLTDLGGTPRIADRGHLTEQPRPGQRWPPDLATEIGPS